MKKTLLEKMANTYILRGLDAQKAEDVDKAREYFANAWGYSSILNNSEFMQLCNQWLQILYLTSEEIRVYQLEGHRRAKLSVNLADAADKMLRNRRPRNC